MEGSFLNAEIEKEILKRQIIAPEDIEETRKYVRDHQVNFNQALMNLGLLEETDLIRIKSAVLGMPFVRLETLSPSVELVMQVPEDFATHKGLIPLEKSADKVVVAMENPLDVESMDRLKAIFRCEIDPVIALRGEILKKVMEYHDHYKANTVQRLLNTVVDQGLALTQRIGINIDHLDDIDPHGAGGKDATQDKGSVVKALNLVILHALIRRASDIHIIPSRGSVRVFYRVDGMLQPAQTLAPTMGPPLISRIKVISKLDIAERRLPQDGSFHIRVENRDIDFRVAVTPTIHGEKAVLRILDKSVMVVGLENIGFSPHHLATIKRIIRKTYGIILITGPTGSGKTTTLYSALQAINTGTRNITTIEDPVEYEIDGITQIQVNPDITLTFANALRSILRQDPDIILVGEIRDVETAEIAIRASLTGHLVFATVHTNDAASAITRLTDMGVAPYLIASSLRAVMSQRLVRTLCLKCKVAGPPTEDDLKSFLSVGKTPGTIYHPKGCLDCFGTGFRGRTVIAEVLEINEEMRQMIVGRQTASRIKEEAIKCGMSLMLDDGIQKVLSGITTLPEILEVTEMIG